MADSKITALTAISTVDPTADPLVIVDVSDTSMAASGTTKKSTINQLLGSGGTATLASATITGAATVGTTLGVTGASTLASVGVTGAATVGTTLGVTGASTLTGSVGIGAASSAKLSVTDTNGIPLRFGDLTAAPASQTACYVGVSTSAFSGNGNGDLILVPRTSDSREVAIYTGSGTAADRFRVTAAGNVNITTGNVVMGTANKGIDFSINSDASATSELLNDYEEGTWVPTQGSGLTVVGTFSSSGTYTKVGRLVTITGVVNAVTSVTAGAGGIICGALPFSASQQVTATAINSTFNAGSFCAVNVTDFYAVTAMAGTTSIRFSATYIV